LELPEQASFGSAFQPAAEVVRVDAEQPAHMQRSTVDLPVDRVPRDVRQPGGVGRRQQDRAVAP
jgi:hypothetical protein